MVDKKKHHVLVNHPFDDVVVEPWGDRSDTFRLTQGDDVVILMDTTLRKINELASDPEAAVAKTWVVIVESRDRSNRPEVNVWQNGYRSAEAAKAAVDRKVSGNGWFNNTMSVFEDDEIAATYRVEAVSQPAIKS